MHSSVELPRYALPVLLQPILSTSSFTMVEKVLFLFTQLGMDRATSIVFTEPDRQNNGRSEVP
jgi:hypothetical protein